MTARFGNLGTLRLGLTLNAVGLLLLAATHNWALLVVALALLVFGQGLATPTISALVANRAHEDRRGGALGFQQSAGSLARIVGPALGGVLFQHAGVPVPYVAGAGLVAVALAALAVPRVALAGRPITPPATGTKPQSSGVH
jgi:MFS family permease